MLHLVARYRLVMRLSLFIAVLFQSLLPLPANAAMLSADASSPYHCGQMSPQLSQQLKDLELPSSLLKQLVPADPTSKCDLCLATLNDLPMPLQASASVAVAATAIAPKVATVNTPVDDFPARYSARAPPQ